MFKTRLELSKCLICTSQSVTSYILNNTVHYLCRTCGAEITFPSSFGAKVATQDFDETVEKVRTALAESNFS